MKTLKQIAQEIGITPQAVLYRIKSRNVQCQRIGRMYLLDSKAMKVIKAKRILVYR